MVKLLGCRITRDTLLRSLAGTRGLLFSGTREQIGFLVLLGIAGRHLGLLQSRSRITYGLVISGAESWLSLYVSQQASYSQ